MKPVMRTSPHNPQCMFGVFILESNFHYIKVGITSGNRRKPFFSLQQTINRHTNCNTLETFLFQLIRDLYLLKCVLEIVMNIIKCDI